MSQMNSQPVLGKCKRKLHTTIGIDMTPMVDLGFLLISFFIFTTTMSEPRATNLTVPSDGIPIVIKESNSLTILLDSNNKILAYEGKWENALKFNRIIPTSYHIKEGLGKMIRAKQKGMSNKDDLALIIKPTAKSSYQNVIDALDETIINNVRRYALVRPAKEEMDFLNKE
jgi:biopolymer transport protein ExbD